jgi:hypothetical protein
MHLATFSHLKGESEMLRLDGDEVTVDIQQQVQIPVDDILDDRNLEDWIVTLAKKFNNLSQINKISLMQMVKLEFSIDDEVILDSIIQNASIEYIDGLMDYLNNRLTIKNALIKELLFEQWRNKPTKLAEMHNLELNNPNGTIIKDVAS